MTFPGCGVMGKSLMYEVRARPLSLNCLRLEGEILCRADSLNTYRHTEQTIISLTSPVIHLHIFIDCDFSGLIISSIYLQGIYLRGESNSGTHLSAVVGTE